MSSLILFVAHGVDAGFLRACDEALRTVLVACRFITPTFMSIALLLSVGKGLLSGQGLQMDFGPVIKALWLFFILFFYQDLMDVLGQGITSFTELFDGESTVTAGEALQKLTTSGSVQAAAQADSMAQSEMVEQGGNLLARMYNSVTNFSVMNLLTQLFTTTTVLLVRNIILFIRQFVLGFLYVCGPLAICLSVIPMFSQLVGKWLQNFIAVQFWALTMSLLDLIYKYYAETTAMPGSTFGGVGMPGQGLSDTEFLVMSAAFIILYCMVPYLTSLFIGSSAVQSFVGTTMGMAVGAAAVAVGAAAPGAGGIPGAIGRAIRGGPGGGGSGGGGSSFGGSAGDGSSSSTSASAGLPTVAMPEGASARHSPAFSGYSNSAPNYSSASFSSMPAASPNFSASAELPTVAMSEASGSGARMKTAGSQGHRTAKRPLEAQRRTAPSQSAKVMVGFETELCNSIL